MYGMCWKLGIGLNVLVTLAFASVLQAQEDRKIGQIDKHIKMINPALSENRLTLSGQGYEAFGQLQDFWGDRLGGGERS